MRKLSKLLLFVSLVGFTSCATIRSKNNVSDYQRIKPKAGEPQRKVKLGPLIWDIVLFGGVGLIVDFATGAIYQDQPTENKSEPSGNK